MKTIKSVIFFPVAFNIITVSLFGAIWPQKFGHEFDGANPTLGYAFYMGCMTLTFNVAAEVLLVIELKTAKLAWINRGKKPREQPEAVTFIGRLKHLYD